MPKDIKAKNAEIGRLNATVVTLNANNAELARQRDDERAEKEKAQIKELFQKVADLNTILDKYDVDIKIDWEDYLIAVGQYFDAVHY